MDVRSLVNDARVLLEQLRRSPWGELHVRTPQGEIFIARHGAGSNPLRPLADLSAGAGAAAVPAGVVVRAPHVGTVLAALPAQTWIEARAVVCRLAVLGEVIEIVSPEEGVLGEVFVVAGELVECESPLFTLVKTQ